MKEKDIHTLFRELFDKYGLTEQGWSFTLTPHRSYFGWCNESEKLIGLSLSFSLLNKKSLVREIILHEIAHALAGERAGHGPAWKEQCLKVGCQPERCPKLDGLIQAPGPYYRRCDRCDDVEQLYRKPKYELYRCRCSGTKKVVRREKCT